MAKAARISAKAARELRTTIKNFEKFERQVRRRSIRETGNKAMRPMHKSTESLARKSEETGLLIKALRKKTRYSKDGNVFSLFIGVSHDIEGPNPSYNWKNRSKVRFVADASKRVGKGEPGRRYPTRKPVKYAHLVEFGTYRSRAKPFIRPAFRRHKHSSRRKFIQFMYKDMDRVARRLARNKRMVSKSSSRMLRAFI